MSVKLRIGELPPEVTMSAASGVLQTMLPAYRTYALELEQIVEEGPQATPLFKGWSFVAHLAPTLGISALVNPRLVFQGLAAGPRFAAAMWAAQEVETYPDLPDDTYEVALLSVPGLSTESLWLLSASGKHDRIVPYEFPVQRKLTANTPYSMDEFIAHIRLDAEERRAADPRFKPPVHPKSEPPAVDLQLKKIVGLKPKRRARRKSKQPVDKKPEPPASA